MTDHINIPSSGFIRLREVLRLIPLSKSSWFRGIQEGKFPAPIKLGPRASAWRAEDIRALIVKLGEKQHPSAKPCALSSKGGAHV